jgi:hypothetical protein
MQSPATRRIITGLQFSLLSLFELTTLCCLIAANWAYVGNPVTVSLICLAASLHFRSGELSLASLMAFCLLAFSHASPSSSNAIYPQLAAVSFATALCAWYWLRRRLDELRAQKNPGLCDRGLTV